MREGRGFSDSKGILLVMKVLYTVLSQQGLVCGGTRVRFSVTLPGAVGSVITVAYLVPVLGNGTCSGGEPVQNPIYHSRYRSGGTEQ